MKKICFLALLAFFSFNVAGQSWYAEFLSLETINCPFDSSVTYLNCKNWRAYQTLNDEWDGPVDSSYCIPVDLVNLPFQGIIKQGTYDANRRVFIKYTGLDSSQTMLQANILHRAEISQTFNNNTNPFDTSCGGKPCNTFIVEIEIPDSAGTGYDYRQYYGGVDSSGTIFSHSCIPIEKFSHNRLSTFVIAAKAANANLDIRMGNAWLHNHWTAQNLDSSSLSHFRFNNQYSFQHQQFMLLHQSNAYPNSNGIYYHDLVPAVNTTTPDTVKLLIDQYSSMTYQPFTQFRAGTVLGGTQRHHLITQMTGGNLCLISVQDIIIFPGDELEFTSGDIRFGNDQSCIMLMGGSKLRVSQNSIFHYGMLGSGLLALRPESNIDLKTGSHLLFDGHLMINPKGESPDSIVVYLDEGETLEFTSMAKISSPAGSKLVVVNRGGSILTDDLAAEYKQWIKVIDAEKDQNQNPFEILVNPIEGRLILSTRLISDVVGEVSLFNLNGAQVYKEDIAFDSSLDEHSIDLESLKSGMYLLKIEAGTQFYTSKVLKR